MKLLRRIRSPPFLFMPYFVAPARPASAGRVCFSRSMSAMSPARLSYGLDKPLTKGENLSAGRPGTFSPGRNLPQRLGAMEFVGHKRWVMPMPVWVALTLAVVLPSSLLGFNRDQILMSQEDNTADSGKFTARIRMAAAGRDGN